jgi:hypothetical protein
MAHESEKQQKLLQDKIQSLQDELRANCNSKESLHTSGVAGEAVD